MQRSEERPHEDKDGDTGAAGFICFGVKRVQWMKSNAGVRNLGLHRHTDRKQLSVITPLHIQSSKRREELRLSPGCDDPDDWGLRRRLGDECIRIGPAT